MELKNPIPVLFMIKTDNKDSYHKLLNHINTGEISLIGSSYAITDQYYICCNFLLISFNTDEPIITLKGAKGTTHNTCLNSWSYLHIKFADGKEFKNLGITPDTVTDTERKEFFDYIKNYDSNHTNDEEFVDLDSIVI